MASNTQKILDFTKWAPDLASIGNQTASVMTNVYPRQDGFGPFPSLQQFSQALPSNCRGFFFSRKSDGSISVFAGTSTDLYQLDNTTLLWVKVSKGGISYSVLVSTDNWQFVQFNDLVIAVQVNTAPQKFILSSATNFVDLGGTPPASAFVAVVGFFLVLTGLLSNPRRAQWSDLGAPETWTAGVGLADFQDMSDGGNVIQCSGGDQYGVIFQQEGVRTITYAPGSAVVFQINRLSTQETLFANNSIINVGTKTFYCGASGFKMIEGSGTPQWIGKELVDRTFFADVDASNLQLMVGASDPNAPRVFWAYKSQQGQAGMFDKILLFDYALNEWTLLAISGEWLGTLARPGLTLEQMDAVALGAITVTGAANNGSGLIRLTVDAVSNAYFTIAGQNFIVVQGINPTYMNGTWKTAAVDATHVDLVGSTFAAAYVSGGKIGGSIETIPFSFDSVSKAAGAALAGFNSLHQLCFFTGPNLEAIMETSDSDPQGSTVEINGARPITDAANGLISIGTRMSSADPVVYSTEYAMDDQGWCEAYVETRFARGRLRIPAGATWTYAEGIQPDVSIAGEN